MAVRETLITGATRPVSPAIVPVPVRTARVPAVDRPLGAALRSSALGIAMRLPVAGRFVRPATTVAFSALRRARSAAAGLVREEAAGVVERMDRLADLVVPSLVREIIARIDVVAIVAEFVDLDRIAALLDVDPVVARVDVDAIVDRLDLDQIARNLDLDAIIDRLDIDRAAARLDLDAVIDRLDLIGLAHYVVDGVDLPELIRSSTESISQEMVQDVRVSAADADRAVERLFDRLLMRRQGRRTALNPPPSPDDDGHAAVPPPRQAVPDHDGRR